MSEKIGLLLTKIIPQEHRWKLELFAQWDTIIGNLREKVRIEKVTERSIVLGVCHPAWAQELFFLIPLLKQKINAVLRNHVISDIRVRTTYHPPKQQNPAPDRAQYGTINAEQRGQLTEQCLTISEHTSLETVKNKELQSALAQFCLRCKTNHTKRGNRDEKDKPRISTHSTQ